MPEPLAMKPPIMDEHIEENNHVRHWSSVFEALLRRYSTVSEAFLMPRIVT
jgi:hypothetical protein